MEVRRFHDITLAFYGRNRTLLAQWDEIKISRLVRELAKININTLHKSPIQDTAAPGKEIGGRIRILRARALGSRFPYIQ